MTALLLSLLLSPWTAQAQDYDVCVDASTGPNGLNCVPGIRTISDAIAAIPPGGSGTIQVEVGTYTESIHVGAGKDIEIIGFDEAKFTITAGVSNEQSGAVVSVGPTGTLKLVDATIAGLNVRAATVDGGSLTLEKAIVTTFGSSPAGGGVYALDGASLTAINTLFLDNIASTWGGHIAAIDSDVFLEDSELNGGIADSRGGGLFAVASGSPRRSVQVNQTRFVDNRTGDADGLGGAIFVNGGVDLDVTRSLFTDQVAWRGGAIADDNTLLGGRIALQDCSFEHNEASFEGGAIHIEGHQLDVLDSRFEHNESQAGGALYLSGPGPFQLTRNLLCGNEASPRAVSSNDPPNGGAVYYAGTTPGAPWTNNRYLDNAASGAGGAVFLERGGLELTYSNFLGNASGSGGAAIHLATDVLFTNNLVAWSAGGASLSGGTDATADVARNGWWDNLGGHISTAFVGNQEVTAAPRLSDYSVGNACVSIADWHDAYSPLRDAADPTIFDLDGTRSDIGAYGGPAAAPRVWTQDFDGDGVPLIYDCNDSNASVNPDEEDVAYDGLDTDCDGANDFDVDGDGEESADHGGTDCDDTRPDISSAAQDIPYDDIDQDCSGADNLDADGDGFISDDEGGDDCDDGDAEVHPGAVERDDDIDRDCDGNRDVVRPLQPVSCSAVGAGGMWPLAAAVLRRR